MKRFWDSVAVVEEAGEFEVRLDGKPIRLPGGGALRVAAPALAEAIAQEWRTAGGGKGGEMSFLDTPLTRLAGTARERIAPDPGPTWDAIARYGEMDLLCYRAEAPRELMERQERLWQPLLDWAFDAFGVSLRVTSGVVPVKQHHDSVDALRRVVSGYDPWMLAGLGIVVPALGSLVLGLALAEGRLDAVEAHALGALDELFQVEQWGEDEEGAKRRAAVEEDVKLAGRFMLLLKGVA